MSSKTITLAAVAFTLTTSLHAPLPALANVLTPAERVQAFATCAGRFSALAARQNAMHDPEFNQTHRIKSDFEMLMEASRDDSVTPTDTRLWRSYGWSEMARLFRERDGFDNAARSARAEADLNRRIHTCERLILPS